MLVVQGTFSAAGVCVVVCVSNGAGRILVAAAVLGFKFLIAVCSGGAIFCVVFVMVVGAGVVVTGVVIAGLVAVDVIVSGRVAGVIVLIGV